LADGGAVGIPYAEDHAPPAALSLEGLSQIREAFAASAVRAATLGIELIQLHAAHGYLLHQFLSPLSNHRDDAYGGALENRMRFPLEVFDVVRDAFPAEKPVSMRVSGLHAATGKLPSPVTVVASLLADPVRSVLRGKVREIGQALMARGGMALMREMADEVEKTDIPFAGDTLDKWWNGISNGKQIWAS
jgi:2,4-dienoyl-CoA reductase-like NADH-dependent reductase (Old Yellow Enzyme family)